MPLLWLCQAAQDTDAVARQVHHMPAPDQAAPQELVECAAPGVCMSTSALVQSLQGWRAGPASTCRAANNAHEHQTRPKRHTSCTAHTQNMGLAPSACGLVTLLVSVLNKLPVFLQPLPSARQCHVRSMQQNPRPTRVASCAAQASTASVHSSNDCIACALLHSLLVCSRSQRAVEALSWATKAHAALKASEAKQTPQQSRQHRCHS
jgi:hypothetical protein